jgi:hypothetical protein
MAAYGATVADLEAGKPVYTVVVPKKLPLGGKVQGSKDPGLFRVYAPSADGGTLTLKTTGGSIAVYGPDGSPAKDAKGQPAASGQEVNFELPGAGWYGVVVTGSKSYELSSRFRILAQAKDKDGSPLVPWHFYYFPFTDVQNQGANHPSAKFDGRFPGTGANDWEKTNYWKSQIDSQGARGPGLAGHGITTEACDAYNAYAGKQVVKFEDCWWWGHCDAASCASTIFTKPQASGNLQPIDIRWALTELSMRGYDIQLKFHLGGLNGNRGSPSNKDCPNGSGQAVDKDIGPLHDALVKTIKGDAHVGLMDFRAPYKEGEDHSADVWNQACYKIEMEGTQADPDAPGGDEEAAARKISFYSILYANADAFEQASANNDPESNPGTGWLRQLTYVIVFDASGNVIFDHPQNSYKRCEWKEASQTLYSPRYLFKINGLNPNGSGPGNPKVTMDAVNQIGVTRRAVFGG